MERKRKESEEHPEPKRSKTTLKRPIIEALCEDGSMDMELLKKISRRSLQQLKNRHADGKCQ